MSLSSLLSKIGASLAAMFVAVAALLAVGSTATATTTCDNATLPAGHYCGDGHPWHD